MYAFGRIALLFVMVWFVVGCLSDDGDQPSIILPSVAEAVEFDTSGMDDFEIVMTVLTHPRCINCHPSGDRPHQTDEQTVHLFNVQRGDNDHGGDVQQCQTCHHEENNPYSLVPGAPHWGLAPASMGWMGLSHAEIAESLLDLSKNGNRTHDDLLEHMANDALVLWGWEPGADRTPIPVSHDVFVDALSSWLEAGAVIPAGTQ